VNSIHATCKIIKRSMERKHHYLGADSSCQQM